jgi:hypothetical protein
MGGAAMGFEICLSMSNGAQIEISGVKFNIFGA